jgi:hypothetical protein
MMTASMKLTYSLLLVLVTITGCSKEREERKTVYPKPLKPLTIAVPDAPLASEQDPEAWGYRLITDGKLFKIQYKWTPTYWGDLIAFGGPFQTRSEAEKALADKRKGAKEYAEEQSREWKPVTN